MDDRALEDYLLLVLSDSNLPTGGFVASSGLESWLQHGYAATSAPPPASANDPPEATDSASRQSGTDGAIKAFVGQSLDSYARLNAPLLRRAHATVEQLRSAGRSTSTSFSAEQKEEPIDNDCTLADILATDALCETMTLNHVARRASIAQGVALLTLYDRAFAPPPRSDEARRSAAVIQLVAEYRSAVKSGKESANGHMSVAFGVLTAAIGISIDSALHLFLFLHARSLLSSAVRLNSIGPYLAHRMLIHDIRPMIDSALERVKLQNEVTSPAARCPTGPATDEAPPNADAGDWWDNDPDWRAVWTSEDAHSQHGSPFTTWPLGEVVASRHDQLFSKVFNS